MAHIFLRFGSKRSARVLTALFLLGIIFGARSAQASLFSSVTKWLGLVSQKVETTLDNSQNMALLQAATNLDPDPVKATSSDLTTVGGTAILSETGPNGTSVDIKDRPDSSQISVYVAKGGESLSAVAKMFGVEVNTILWANDLTKGYVPKEGDVLTILPVDGVIHTVKKGETLASIAKKYRGDIDDIRDYNDINPEAELVVGDMIIIPEGKVVVPGQPAKPKTRLADRYTGPDTGAYFLRPIAGGRRSQGIHGRNGVDLASSVGTPVYASAGGTVLLAKSGWNGGYGNYIIVRHANGTQTLYSHLSQINIARGQTVARGQTIGAVGNTGRSTGPHLHFEVHGAKNPF
ncbi:MAG: Peptidase M23 family protein [Candidatus Woesebacteria bacterium GW2011_GWA1_39_21b]|uniref:LysM domain-containing protein n=3 Tax=Patescibacteria group TaxID=1783273 RepID=A0A1G2QCD0_9BACT|nr:MAG: Peptidase M23 family protein [Candidatus Woesebacteria bacterium GW2011_GWA1_39_21b]KKS77452.1 MAG: Peptidase M23 family protein [Parcubacteria group bacterium GW2011_GWB1_42_9]KKS88974.1 MAG: Peptidase M23 family protein [Parcubacteria group bacterium GW2011_GWC1_43_11b]OHA57769.1 MAG: hypothetical protein A2370_02510 [Candidatus Vogelbacteria bacterium RIFOXYB1_FULL_42_16]OHA59003.1 MAG: hypothetical protein A2607_02075 [Candidatus Vogelbacteria bacterium RIFOXYD1_FULL_42_15]